MNIIILIHTWFLFLSLYLLILISGQNRSILAVWSCKFGRKVQETSIKATQKCVQCWKNTKNTCPIHWRSSYHPDQHSTVDQLIQDKKKLELEMQTLKFRTKICINDMKTWRVFRNKQGSMMPRWDKVSNASTGIGIDSEKSWKYRQSTMTS